MAATKPLKIIAGAPDKPLRIGSIEIPCYVLEGEVRVLAQRGVVSGLDMARGGGGGDGDRLLSFVGGKKLSPFISNELRMAIQNPIIFDSPLGGSVAYGYPATIIPDLCEAVLAARQDGQLQAQQEHIAERCEILVRGLARIGIIGLIDEATGYQELRSKRALAEILEQYIAKELQPWTKTFPEEFYKQIWRLRGWSYTALAEGERPARPGIVGRYTVDFVYRRIAPGLWHELQQKSPVQPDGRRKDKLHQWFTPDIGHPKLKEHIAAVMALQRASSNWGQFSRSVNRAFPIQNDQIEFDFPEDDEDDE